MLPCGRNSTSISSDVIMTNPHFTQFFIDGQWVEPIGSGRLPVENPATEEIVGEIALGSAADICRAVKTAKAAFAEFSVTPVQERIAILKRLLAAYNRRYQDVADAMRIEMGAPAAWARDAQAWAGQVHLEAAITAAEKFAWEEKRGSTLIVREGIGVCGLITPWNWPMNQIVCKVAPALAAGCTMVLKPSEIAPLSAIVFAELIEEAGVPAGVFNLVNGTGAEAGTALSSHPEVDMMSFTGSTRAGILVAQAAAPTVKRVAQELGGKSANIILPSANLKDAVTRGTLDCFSNTGQSCDAPTRMLVPASRLHEACDIAAEAAASVVPGDPLDPQTTMGPLVSELQYHRVQTMIEKGIAEGSPIVAGGPGRPDGLERGWYARPTVFGPVNPDAVIAREEIFGPVLVIIPYRDVDEAVAIANDSVYGLAAYVQGAPDEARAVARRLRAGQVSLNGPDWDVFAPFGGYRQSGNGREYADWGLHDFCETKAIVGYGQ